MSYEQMNTSDLSDLLQDLYMRQFTEEEELHQLQQEYAQKEKSLTEIQQKIQYIEAVLTQRPDA